MTAGIIGLTVITLERYFKIVHAIAHRKYYRKPEILSRLDDVGGRAAAVVRQIHSHSLDHSSSVKSQFNWIHNSS